MPAGLQQADHQCVLQLSDEQKRNTASRIVDVGQNAVEDRQERTELGCATPEYRLESQRARHGRAGQGHQLPDENIRAYVPADVTKSRTELQCCLSRGNARLRLRYIDRLGVDRGHPRACPLNLHANQRRLPAIECQWRAVLYIPESARGQLVAVRPDFELAVRLRP